MSIKHRVKDRAEDGKMRALWLGYNYRPSRKRLHRREVAVNFGKSPSWFNREFNNVPKRREAARLCRDIVAGRRESDVAIFPLEAKPNLYYW